MSLPKVYLYTGHTQYQCKEIKKHHFYSHGKEITGYVY